MRAAYLLYLAKSQTAYFTTTSRAFADEWCAENPGSCFQEIALADTWEEYRDEPAIVHYWDTQAKPKDFPYGTPYHHVIRACHSGLAGERRTQASSAVNCEACMTTPAYLASLVKISSASW